MHFDREQEEIELLKRQERTEEEIERDLDRIVGFLKPRLAFIKISFGGNMAQGPVKLNVGQKTTASVLGFDQNGAPFAIDFTANPVTWADDNQAAASDAPAGATDVLTGVAAGVSNLTATCGGFTDTEQATVSAVVPVLSSIKIDFSGPA
jgi:hypothetical protein